MENVSLGYNFSYPFLSVDTGINVDENCIKPLYKQIFNIEHPTMIFIGVPFTACTIRVYDIQVNRNDIRKCKEKTLFKMLKILLNFIVFKKKN